jgi:hypothetical protein
MTSATIGGLATSACLLRSRYVRGQVVIGGVGLSALAGVARGNLARARARLAAPEVAAGSCFGPCRGIAIEGGAR